MLKSFSLEADKAFNGQDALTKLENSNIPIIFSSLHVQYNNNGYQYANNGWSYCYKKNNREIQIECSENNSLHCFFR